MYKKISIDNGIYSRTYRSCWTLLIAMASCSWVHACGVVFLMLKNCYNSRLQFPSFLSDRTSVNGWPIVKSYYKTHTVEIICGSNIHRGPKRQPSISWISSTVRNQPIFVRGILKKTWHKITHLSTKCNKKLRYRRVTARCVLLVVILPVTTQQCRNYLYDNSWPNRWYEVGGLVGGNVS